MSSVDQARLEEARKHPRIVQLWWALRPLTSVVRLMNSGAHPDDETSAMLAAIGLRDGINLSYACSTRGEGGQNDIGTERGAALGALRTREMERACDVLNMRMYWHSTSPEDPISDFRFSKSGHETLDIWGQDRLLSRFVEIVRSDRPDILMPTFLDVPGQHGHHRAMTQAAHLVMEAAADPDFDCALPPWQIKKLYLPAWSGAGQAYDDDLPPPPATLDIDGTGADPITGWDYARIGQMSRAYHCTQGMGRWVPPGGGQIYPLHLAQTSLDGADDTLTSGLPRTLADLAPVAPTISHELTAAQDAIDACVAAFPDFAAVARHAARAEMHVRAAMAACPADAHPDLAHRLKAKGHQLGRVLYHAYGASVVARLQDPVWVRPGSSTGLDLEWQGGDAPSVALDCELPDGWRALGNTLQIDADASLHDPYPTFYDPSDPPVPRVRMSLGSAHTTIAFETTPIVLPPNSASLSPDAVVVNRAAQSAHSLDVALSDQHPPQSTAGLGLSDGWHSTPLDTGLRVTWPKDTAPGLYSLPLKLDGEPAHRPVTISHAHVAPTAVAAPAHVQLRIVDVALPKARIGYIGSGHDDVAASLTAIGADVTAIGDAELASNAALEAYDTLVIGIFALRFRAGLAEAMPRIHRWVESGGTLLTLYHRPWDNWSPDTTPPRRLEIGQPSLRWRVTNAAATVTHLVDHPILQGPNPITQDDWDGWKKERGLYFAKNWDPIYTALLSMADPEEEPLTGSLLSGEIGNGRYTHCALGLHLQMQHLVPGAFRLMANLVTPR